MVKRRKKPGPKPRAADTLHLRRLNIPVTEDELRTYQDAAGRTPLSRWARAILNRKVGKE